MNTSLPDLECVYADAAGRLPTDDSARLPQPLDCDQVQQAGQPESAWMILYTRGSLPVPPPGLSTARICIQAGSGGHGSITVDLLLFSAHRETYRALGLFILGALLTPGPNRFELALTHPASNVRRLIVDTMYREIECGMGLKTEASGVNYVPNHRSSIPAAEYSGGERYPPHPDDLPHLIYTDEEGVSGPGEEHLVGARVRDTVVGFRSDQGAYFLAELLLDISQEWNAEVEYKLELPCGRGGVAPTSAEARLLLPGGSAWWNPDHWAAGEADHR